MSRKIIKRKRIGKIEYRLIYNEVQKIYRINKYDEDVEEKSDELTQAVTIGFYKSKKEAEREFD